MIEYMFSFGVETAVLQSWCENHRQPYEENSLLSPYNKRKNETSPAEFKLQTVGRVWQCTSVVLGGGGGEWINPSWRSALSVQQALGLSGLNIVERKTVGFGNSVAHKVGLGIYLSGRVSA